MKHRTQEKGQALVLITLAAIGLFAFAALAIDGSRVYSEKRHAQNAADTAALAGALAYQRGNDISLAATGRATSNGYDSGVSNDVTVTITDIAAGTINKCPGNTAGKEITVKIVAYVNTTFARVIGRPQITTAVTATTLSCGFYLKPLLTGDAVIGLNTQLSNAGGSTCPIDSGNGDWYITGSGVYSNGCTYAHSDFDLDGHCLTTVGPTSGVSECMQPSAPLPYPDAATEIMPPNPCDGTAGDIGIAPTSGQTTFNDGVYCISDMDALDNQDVILNNATLYVTDTNFRLMFGGHGGFSGTATQAGTFSGSGDYDDYFMVIAMHSPPCPDFAHGDQALLIRGNSGETLTGTILAPSACLDLRGNSGYTMNSQIIGYTVSSNGTAELHVNYDDSQNHLQLVQPSATMYK